MEINHETWYGVCIDKMIRKLRIRLTFLFGSLTSLILIILLAIAWNLSRLQYLTSQDNLYQTQLQNLSAQLGQVNTITGSWLTETIQETSSFLYIEASGKPLHYFSMKRKNPEYEHMLQAFIASIPVTDDESYVSEIDGISYKTSILHTNPYVVIFSKSLQEQRNHIRQLTLIFTLMGLAGAAALFLVSAYLSGLAAAPVNAFLQEQEAFIAAASHELKSPLTVIQASLYELNQELEQIMKPESEKYAANSNENTHNNRYAIPIHNRKDGNFILIHDGNDGNLIPTHNENDKNLMSIHTTDKLKHLSSIKKTLQLADKEASRMGKLIKDLLTITGSRSGKWNIHLQPVELDTICLELYERFEGHARQTHKELKLLLPDETLPVIRSDADRLIQLLSTLLSNALDYAPEGTDVTLQAKTTGKYIFFYVTDHGNGIPDEEKEAVFHRFYRSEKSHTSKEHFGLGLSIARELSDLLDGDLSVRDTEGGGATFVLKLKIR